jgi:acetyltransferase
LPSVGSIICILTPQDQTPVEKIAETIIEFKNKTKKTIITVFLGGKRVEVAVGKLKEAGVCNFSFPDQAVDALDGYFCWNKFRQRKVKTQKKIINEKRREKILDIIRKAKEDGRTALYFSESAQMMEMYGVRTVNWKEIFPGDKMATRKTNKLSLSGQVFPVVLKIDSDKVLHKTDKQGIVLGIENEKDLNLAVKKMQLNFPGARLVVQPMVNRGTELIIGIKRDANFGGIVVYGLGGIYTEILHRVDYLVPPLPLSQIEESLRNGKLSFLFSGARGQKEYNAQELAETLQGIAMLSVEIPEILEFDINPLIVYNNGKLGIAVDVKIVI